MEKGSNHPEMPQQKIIGISENKEKPQIRISEVFLFY